MNQSVRKIWTDDERRHYQEAVTRYRRFMALTVTLNNLIKKIEYLGLSPGVTFRAVTDNGGTKYKSSKASIAERYAVGGCFVMGALEILERELGTKWKDKNYSNDGLW